MAEARSIVRKYPTRFSNIQYGGSKTIGRSGLAKKYKKIRKEKAAFEKKYPGNKMLTSLRGQRDAVKSAIKSAKRRKIGLPNK